MKNKYDNLNQILKRIVVNSRLLKKLNNKLNKLEMIESRLNILQMPRNDIIIQIDDLADEIEILKDQINVDEDLLIEKLNYKILRNENIEDDRKSKKLKRRKDK